MIPVLRPNYMYRFRPEALAHSVSRVDRDSGRAVQTCSTVRVYSGVARMVDVLEAMVGVWEVGKSP